MSQQENSAKVKVQQTTFRYRAYRSLKSALGEADATVECLEVAVRKLEAEASASGNPHKFLTETSDSYSIRVNQLDIGNLRLRAAHLYVLSIYQHAEQFLDRFWREVPGSENWPQRDKLDLGTWIYGNLIKATNPMEADAALYKAVFDYYRFVRDRFMHSSFDADKLNLKHQETVARWKEAGKWPQLDAPNEYEAMRFDDFILFSRVTKELAFLLNGAARPTDEQIVEIVLRDYEAEVGAEGLRRMNRFKNNRPKLSSVIYKLVNRNYSLSEDEAKPVVEMIVRGLLA